MKRRFRISSLALAGLSGLGAASAMPLPPQVRSDEQVSAKGSLFQTFRQAKAPFFKQHRSHRSHQSHGSHRSGSGGARPRPTPAPAPYRPPARPAPQEPSDSSPPSSVLPSSGNNNAPTTPRQELSELARVQAMLSALGYYTGAIDGIDGALTRAAISRFQADRGLPVTGQVNDQLLTELGLVVQE